jgi:hypothetical protein
VGDDPPFFSFRNSVFLQLNSGILLLHHPRPVRTHCYFLNANCPDKELEKRIDTMADWYHNNVPKFLELYNSKREDSHYGFMYDQLAEGVAYYNWKIFCVKQKWSPGIRRRELSFHFACQLKFSKRFSNTKLNTFKNSMRLQRPLPKKSQYQPPF